MSRVVRFALALTLCPTLLLAGDPWKQKDYTQWTKEDVARILEDSPWAVPVRVQPTWASDSNVMVENQPTRDRNIFSSPATMKDASAGPQLKGVVFHIVWRSSRVVRQAQARSAVLAGTLTPEEAEKGISQLPANYEVEISGADMVPFGRIEEAALRASATLTPKGSKRPIAPTRVLRLPDGQGYLGAVVFIFPKEDSGEPTIAAGEKRVEFACKIAKNVLRASFDLTKMMGRQGPDF